MWGEANGVLPNLVVDTTVLPPADRFAFWYALVAQETAPAHISSSQLDNFVAYAQAIDLGPRGMCINSRYH